MFPLRLVLDTDIVVSAALVPNGLPRTVFLLAITKPVRFCVSPQILEEYRDVLARPELSIRKGLCLQFLQLIKNNSRHFHPTRSLQITGDPADNIFVECADASHTDYLVTGNLRHFPKYWKSAKIVSDREFIEIVSPHLFP